MGSRFIAGPFLHIQEDFAKPASLVLAYPQLVPGDSLDYQFGRLAGGVAALSESFSSYAAAGELFHMEGPQSQLAAVEMVQNFTQPVHQQRLARLAFRGEPVGLARLDTLGFHGDVGQGFGGAGEQFRQGGSMSAETEVGRVFEDFIPWV